MRTWTAVIEVRTARSVATLDASESQYDLLDDQTKVAAREAALFVDESSEVHVVVRKTTRARGTENDRSFHVYRDARGVVRYSR